MSQLGYSLGVGGGSSSWVNRLEDQGAAGGKWSNDLPILQSL